MKFKLNDEYIELMKLLKFMNICMTGGEARIRIDNGEVDVDGETEFRKRRKLRTGAVVNIDNYQISIE